MTTNHVKPIISLKNFCGKIIDYAGLFPPSSLELLQAFHNFVFYSQGEFKWMLGKFIIPARRLGELGRILDDMQIEDKVPLSVIGSSEETITGFGKAFSGDLNEIKEFISKYSDSVSIDAFEVRLPSDLYKQEENDEMLELMISISNDLQNLLGKNIPVFYEAVLTKEFEIEIIRTVETIAALDKGCGYKLRTGGIEASAFPEPEVIAFAIMTCCEFSVPMKFTAGLHHPVRHFNEEVSAIMHGFLNVFAAGIMAYTNNLDEAELLEVLNEEDPYEFVFTENGLEWHDIHVSNPEIKGSRDGFVLSYGSCSFDEPIEDLKTMELF